MPFRRVVSYLLNASASGPANRRLRRRARSLKYSVGMTDPELSDDDLTALRSDTRERLAKLPCDYSEAQIDAFLADRLDALRRICEEEPERPSMIFVCVHNAGRSQMSAGWARHLAGDRAVVYSGGSRPGHEVNPVAIEAMAEIGIDISDQFPKPFTDEIVEASDVVVTMGCGDACPFFPGKRYLDWELTDPHGQGIDQVRVVRDEIERRVRTLLSELGILPAG